MDGACCVSSSSGNSEEVVEIWERIWFLCDFPPFRKCLSKRVLILLIFFLWFSWIYLVMLVIEFWEFCVFGCDFSWDFGGNVIFPLDLMFNSYWLMLGVMMLSKFSAFFLILTCDCEIILLVFWWSRVFSFWFFFLVCELIEFLLKRAFSCLYSRCFAFSHCWYQFSWKRFLKKIVKKWKVLAETCSCRSNFILGTSLLVLGYHVRDFWVRLSLLSTFSLDCNR